MSTVGYYRYKTLADSEKDVTLYINNVATAVKSVVPIEGCAEDRILKYLDKNGQYRFYPFNQYYRINDNPVKIGGANKFLTNILDDQTAEQNIGYRNTRVMLLRADVPNDELEKLTDLYVSPRVYLYVGSGNSDSTQDWLEVEVQVSDPVVRRRKRNTSPIQITVVLPEHYTIKMV